MLVRSLAVHVGLALIAAGNCAALAQPTGARSLDCDLLIVGATESGWAAAIQAARMGVPSIVIVHDGDWVGGQFTEQALACVDENKGIGKVGWGVDWHPMKRSFHRSGLFRELMDTIESFNAAKYGDAMPGRPYHGPSTFRPAEAEALFRKFLKPLIDRGQVRLITQHYPVAAQHHDADQPTRLTGLSFAAVGETSADLHVASRLTIDASDWGEAIQVSGAEFECGPDPQTRYHEPSAPETLADNPVNEMNPITWAMVLEQPTGREAIPIQQPERFDDRYFVRSSKLSLAALRDLSWDRPVKLGSILHWPKRGQQSPRQLSVYNVRRLIEGSTSRQQQTVILLNYMLGQDYPLERLPAHVAAALEATEAGASKKNLVRMSRGQREIVFRDARRHSLSLLYHLQNFVHEHAEDTANSFRNFELSKEFGTPDHLPPKPYIRESLRLKAMYMMREQDGRNVDGKSKTLARERFAQVMYPDGVFCWQFHYDFHRTGRAYLKSEGNDGPWIDFEKPGRHTHHVSDRSVFPLRSLIPESMDGLIGAQKNLGYSSIVCAAIRLHDQGVATGQAAGATAAVALRRQVAPRVIPYNRELLEQVRDGLCGGTTGVPLLLYPFRDLAPDHQAFVAINRLAAAGMVVGSPYQVDFQPDAIATESWQRAMIDRVNVQLRERLANSVVPGLSRAEFCQWLWNRCQDRQLQPFIRLHPTDADADGIVDRDDPIPFTPAPPVIWSIRPPPADEDGVPNDRPEEGNLHEEQRLFNFGPRNPSETVEPTLADHGLRYDRDRGFGWTEDLSLSHRRRHRHSSPLADTFVFTRDHACWTCDLPNGRYRVALCVGDAAHDQPGQQVRVEGVQVIDHVSTAAGRFCERTVVVEVDDGQLTIELGPQRAGQNTCLNWLVIAPDR